MNIFVLDDDPIYAAQMMCDKHIPKMIVESAQMMASALRKHGASDELMPVNANGRPYKGGYQHHPCTVWTSININNYMWLYTHAYELCMEYRLRFSREHACESKIMKMVSDAALELLPMGVRTPFARAFNKERYPHLYDTARYTTVDAYRTYYLQDKRRFASWKKGRPAPQWWETMEE